MSHLSNKHLIAFVFLFNFFHFVFFFFFLHIYYNYYVKIFTFIPMKNKKESGDNNMASKTETRPKTFHFLSDVLSCCHSLSVHIFPLFLSFFLPPPLSFGFRILEPSKEQRGIDYRLGGTKRLILMKS